MIKTALAVFELSASSGFRSIGQATTWRVMEARIASTKSRDAGESSKSCTMTGRLFTVNESDTLISSNKTSGSTRARASVRQSRQI